MRRTSMTLILPMRDDAATLPFALQSIASQWFAIDRLTVIAVDRGSHDASAAIVERWLAATGIRGRVLRIDDASESRALNCAILAADPKDFLVRLDARTAYGSTCLARVAGAFEHAGPSVWCIGTAPSARDPEVTRDVELGVWRPGVLQRLGGFDERWLANEDGELAARLRAAGGVILGIDLARTHPVASGVRAALRRCIAYGHWRAQTLRRHPREWRVRHVARLLALAATIVLCFTPFREIAFAAIGVRAGIVALRQTRRDVSRHWLPSIVYGPALHAARACAFFHGIVFGWAHPNMRVFGIGDRRVRS